MLAALGLFLVIEVVGLLAAPLAALVFGRLPGAGLGFAKVLGLLLVTWLDVDGGVAAHRRLRRAADRRRARAAGGRQLAVGAAAALARRSLGGGGSRRRRARLARLALPPDDPVRRRLFWGAEAVFAVCYALGALLASFAPDVWNTEKPMDMAFITAINASSHFPPHDPWMSGEPLNYYYLGHMVFAWPIELLGLRPDAGYLLSWGLLLALTATAVYTFAGTLWAAARDVLGDAGAARRAGRRGAGGRRAGGDPRQPGRGAVVAERRRPAARLRVVRPLAGDPGHDQRVPVVLVHPRRPARPRAGAAVHGAGAGLRAAGRAARAARRRLLWRAVAEALVAGLAVGMLYAINSWSYPVAAGVLAAAVITWMRGDPQRRWGYPLVVARARAGGELRADPAVPVELRPGGARDRRRAHAARRSANGWATWR